MPVTAGEPPEADVAPLKLEALDWASRLAIGPVSDADWHAFEAWRRTSPAHEAAFATAAAFMAELRALDLSQAAPDTPPGVAAATVVPFVPRARMTRRALIGGGGAIAASVALGIGTLRPPLGLWPSLAELMAEKRTGPGERGTITPMAGVTVELSSRSSVSRTATGIALVSGEIFVALARAARFSVEAGALRVAATGADAGFNLRAYDGEWCVACTRGTVTATRDGTTTTLKPGEAASWTGAGPAARSRIDPGVATAWRRGLLIFEGVPLARAIAQINRFYPGRLVLRREALAARPITGVFHTDQIELAAVQIQNLTGAQATRLPGGIVLFG